jgi:hypothetical protein
LVETSSLGTLSVGDAALVNASAPNGHRGTWLIDPTDIIVANTGPDGVGCALATCTISDETLEAALNGANVVLSATNSITINRAVNTTGNANPGDLTFNTVTFILNDDITLKTNSSIAVNNTGIFTAGAGDTLNVSGTGTITLRQNSGGSIQNAINAIGTQGSTPATIFVGSGTYDENLSITKNLALLGNPNTAAPPVPEGHPYPTLPQPGADANAPRINQQGSADPAIKISGNVTDVVIRGFVIDGDNKAAISANINNSGVDAGSSITIDRNTIFAETELAKVDVKGFATVNINYNLFFNKTDPNPANRGVFGNVIHVNHANAVTIDRNAILARRSRNPGNNEAAIFVENVVGATGS